MTTELEIQDAGRFIAQIGARFKKKEEQELATNGVNGSDIADFIRSVDLHIRVPEHSEEVDGDDARRYNTACDYPSNSDYSSATEALKIDPGIGGKTALEVGPGPGNLCGELFHAGAGLVVGIDPSQEMLAYTRNKFAAEIATGRMQFEPESVYCLAESVLAGMFDLVVCQNTLHQMFEPRDALFGMISALRPGGQVHIWDFRRDISSHQLEARIRYTKPIIWRDLANSICAALTKQEARSFLEEIAVAHPELSFTYSVSDAINPALLSEQARAVIAEDPVPHYKDFAISQKITIYRS